MPALLGMPQGAEWLVILAIVVLLFGSAKLPALVKQLGKSKKIWEDEIGTHGKQPDTELDDSQPKTHGTITNAPTESQPDHRQTT